MTEAIDTVPAMTPDAAQRLRKSGICTRSQLHEWVAYDPRAISYIADVSMRRIELWIGGLERDQYALQAGEAQQ